MANNSNPDENENFSSWLANLTDTYKSLSSDKKQFVLETLIANSGPSQLYSLTSRLSELLHRDFITHLPQELVATILNFLDGKQMMKCCQVCRGWRDRIDGLTDVWSAKAYELGADVQENLQKRDHILNREKFNSSAWPSKTKLYKELYLHTAKFLHGLQTASSIKTTQGFVDTGNEIIRSFYYTDGLVFTGHDQCVKVWSVADGNLIIAINTSRCLNVILLYKDSVLYMSSLNCSVEIWNVDSGARESVLVGHTGIVTAIDVNKYFVVTVSVDKSIKVWDVSSRGNPTLVSTVDRAHSQQAFHFVNILQYQNDKDLKFVSCDGTGLFSWSLIMSTKSIELSHKYLIDMGLEISSYCADLLDVTRTIFISKWNSNAKVSWLSCYKFDENNVIALKQSWQITMKGLRVRILGVGSRFALIYCSISCQDLYLFDLAAGTFLVTIVAPQFLSVMYKGTPHIHLCDKSWLNGFVFDRMVPDKPVFVACNRQVTVMIGKWNVVEINDEAEDAD